MTSNEFEVLSCMSRQKCEKEKNKKIEKIMHAQNNQEIIRNILEEKRHAYF